MPCSELLRAEFRSSPGGRAGARSPGQVVVHASVDGGAEDGGRPTRVGRGERRPVGVFPAAEERCQSNSSTRGLDRMKLQTFDRFRCPKYDFHNIRLCASDITLAFFLFNKIPISLFLFS